MHFRAFRGNLTSIQCSTRGTGFSSLSNVRVLILILFSLGGAGQAGAQDISLRGVVTDRSEAKVLPGAAVSLWNGGEMVSGTAADADGFFILHRLEPGSYLLRASFVGYRVFQDSLQLRPGEHLRRAIELEPASATLDELVVEAGAADQAVRMDAGFPTTATQTEIELIPAPDVSGDLANFLTAQPGILSSGDRGGQIFVQGGGATENLVLLDGMPVFQPFHLVGFYSVFPSDIISQADVYGAGFGPRYGGRLSSVFDVSTRGGNLVHFGGAASAAPFVSAALLEGPILPRKLSFLLSIRRSMIDKAADYLIKEPLPFEFGDAFAKLHASFSQNNMLSVHALRTFDRGTLSVENDGRDDIEWQSDAVGIRHLLFPSDVPMRAEVTAFYSRLHSTLGGAAMNRWSTVDWFGGGANATYYGRLFDLHGGAFVGTSRFEYKLTGLFQNYESGRENATDAGLYVAPEFRVSRHFRIFTGIRLHAFPSKRETYVEPRLSLAWVSGAHRLHASFGTYHQQVVGLTDKRDPANVFTVWTASPVGSVPSSEHLTAGYRLRPNSWFEASVSGYLKESRNLQVAEWTLVPSFSPAIEPVNASATGLDLQVHLRTPRYSVSAGYGYSDVWYSSRRQGLSRWYGALMYQPPHNRRRKFSLLAAADVFEFDVSARWQYGSGPSYSQPLGFDEFILMDGAVDPFTEEGTRRIIYGNPFSDFLPSYHRLDISLAKTWTWQQASLTLHSALINAYDRPNILYMDLYTGRRVKQLPLFPSLGIKVAFR